MQNEMMSLPWRTSSFTSASTTKAFSVPRFSVRRLMRGIGGRQAGAREAILAYAAAPSCPIIGPYTGTRMLINCAAYQDGKKLGDIAPQAISKYVSRPEGFVS